MLQRIARKRRKNRKSESVTDEPTDRLMDLNNVVKSRVHGMTGGTISLTIPTLKNMEEGLVIHRQCLRGGLKTKKNIVTLQNVWKQKTKCKTRRSTSNGKRR